MTLAAMVENKRLALRNKFNGFDYGYWLGLIFFVLVVLSIVYSGYKMRQKLLNVEDMPVSTLQIMGVRPYSSDNEIHQVLRRLSLHDSFFSLDVNEVQQELERIKWIKQVTVRRQWPNGLIIHVTDHTPVAYWNDDWLLNIYGEVFEAPQTRIKQWLPKFYATQAMSKQVLKGYRALWPLLESEGLKLSEIMLTPRQSWNVTLDNGSTLILGRGNDVIRNVRVERFLKVYKHVFPQAKDINYVDLRYDAGFAVNWKKHRGDRAKNEQG